MLISDLRVFTWLLGALELGGAILFLASRKKPALIAVALQPLLLIAGEASIIASQGLDDASGAWLATAGFLGFEILLLGFSIVWIWRGPPRKAFFWACWSGNLLPLSGLVYFAYFFHIF